MIKIYAPASIGNVNVGFDILGAAVTPIDGTIMGDCVLIEAADKFSLKNKGKFVNKLPMNNKDNVVYQCWKKFCKTIYKNVQVTITLEKNMPISSGLGSSACSIVASLIAMNEFCNKPLNNNELLFLMGEVEGQIAGSIHYDNVAPCFLGGLQLIIDEGGIISQKVPCFDDWLWVMAYPGIKVSTAEARAILPMNYCKEIVIKHSRLLASFIHACHTNQSILAANLMQDVVAESYRTKLLPGFTEARQATTNMGAIACGISGSGPTIFAVCNKIKIAQKIADWLKKYYLQNEEGFVHICQLDKVGARQLG